MFAERRAGLPQSLLLLSGSCLPVLGAVLIAPVLPRMQAHFADVAGVEVLVPIVLTIPALVIALLAPLAGMIADRLGRRPLLLLSMLLYGICGLAPFWLDSLPAILASRAGLGLAEAGIMTCCTTLMGDYFSGAQRHRLFALQMVATSLSAAIFIALGGALGQNDWRLPFALYAAGFVFLPLMALLLWEPARHEPCHQALSRGDFPWRRLLPLYVLTLMAGISLFIVPVQAGYLLNLLQVEAPRDIGLTMGANQFGVLVGALSFRRLSHLRRSVLLLLAFGTAGTGGLLMAFSTSHGMVTIAVLINGLGIGLMLPTLITQVMAQVDYEHRGRATGGFTAALFAGEFMSPLVVLALTGASGSDLSLALAIVGLAQLLVAGICAVLFRGTGSVPSAEAGAA
ncbi:MFS transporter [Marinobacterium nitratireducens]|uniref:MFS transporter n=1 Tax=Marinobacterium nitratireducens TaxID=518897 RepID=A0A917Z6E0_9GAMM|nr:MFS transporter [Marinobacterium nitratireducens]GGO76459.1 MFS transporter [Marinobacterium nitratireducens]